METQGRPEAGGSHGQRNEGTRRTSGGIRVGGPRGWGRPGPRCTLGTPARLVCASKVSLQGWGWETQAQERGPALVTGWSLHCAAICRQGGRSQSPSWAVVPREGRGSPGGGAGLWASVAPAAGGSGASGEFRAVLGASHLQTRAAPLPFSSSGVTSPLPSPPVPPTFFSLFLPSLFLHFFHSFPFSCFSLASFICFYSCTPLCVPLSLVAQSCLTP